MREPPGKPGPTDPDQTEGQAYSVAEAVGGPLGIAESTIPFVAFTSAWALSGNDVIFGALVAVGISAVLAALRLLKGESVQYALSGLAGVALGAFVASRTGDASNFFLPGIIINSVSLAAYLGSILIGRPLLGFFVSQLSGEGSAWHEDPTHRSAYTKASWIWVGLFAFRLSIQVPLYVTEAVGPLAAARVVTGVPLFALAAWVSYLILRPILPSGMTPTRS